MRILFVLLFACVFGACTKDVSKPPQGHYLLKFHTINGNIPARLEISETGVWSILNSDEVIRLESTIIKGDSFFIQLPLFDSSMKGTWRDDSLMGIWTDHSRKEYSIPFSGVVQPTEKLDNEKQEFRYDVIFSPEDSSESSKGIAVLQKCGSLVTGTILTETGDYRYLEGEWKNDFIWLSAFDGTHLFYLSGVIAGDKIMDGIFLSGKHWKEHWVATKSNGNILRDPNNITTLQKTNNPEFAVLSSTGSPVLFDSSSWKNHVTIIQIMGSWCPNCTDESKFLLKLYENYNSRGLQIIPIAFERGDDVTTACNRVRAQFDQLGIPYAFYYGGKASKEEAHKVLNFLSEVHSFPTSIFIDKTGVVRSVHTGFYGPGTHAEYEKHSTELTQLVEQLVSE